MGSIGPFPGWLAAVGFMVAIDWGIMQVDPQGAFVFAAVVLVSVLVLRPNAMTSLTDTFGLFLSPSEAPAK